MHIRDDKRRYEKVGDEKRPDLEEFIQHGELQGDGNIRIPIKIVDPPEFSYDKFDKGGFGKGEGDVGDPVDADDSDGEGDGDEAGEGGGEHEYYEMDPEEFAERLDERLGLNLKPKGKKISEEVTGDFTDVARTGPDSTLLLGQLIKSGIRRKVGTELTTDEEETIKELLRVSGYGPSKVYTFVREEYRLPISEGELQDMYEEIEDKTKYNSIDEVDLSVFESGRHFDSQEMSNIPIRSEDKRHQYPRIIEKQEKNVVIVNIRDVSGSMRKTKRELVERTFAPLDWYLQGKYDKADFVYIAHDSDAWEVEAENFFGIRSGGGTRISSAYELAQEILEEYYPWDTWNRYVFAAGDGENDEKDSRETVAPLMEEINANLHAYLQVTPKNRGGSHGKIISEELGDRDNVAVAYVGNNDEVIDAIEHILTTEGDNE